MSRTDVQLDPTPASPPVGATETGRVVIAGITQTGPDTPTLINGWAQWQQTYGQRVDATAAVYDAVQLFFAERGAQVVMLSAGGPTATFDDEADYAAVLSKLTLEHAGMAIAWPGAHGGDVHAALIAAAKRIDGHALLDIAPAALRPAAESYADDFDGNEDAQVATLAWPAVKTVAGVTVAASAFVAACRSRAHARFPGIPFWGARYGKSVTGLAPAVPVTDEDFDALDAKRISVIQTVYGVTTLMGAHVLAPIGGNENLDESAQRDAYCALSKRFRYVTHEDSARFTNRGDLLAWQQALAGVAAEFAAAGVLTPPDPSLVPAGVTADPGYVVDTGPSVNTATDLATGNTKAHAKVRFAGTQEFALMLVGAADAAAAPF